MNPKLKAAITAVTNLIHQEGPLAYEELLALTGKSEMVLSAAMNEMVNTGIVTIGTDRATGNKKYVLTAQAKKEVAAAAAAEKKAKAKPAPKAEAEPVPVPVPEPTPEPVPVLEPVPEPAPMPTPVPEPVSAPAPTPVPEAVNKTPQPVQRRAKRLAPNPMVGCFLHNGNIIIKLDRRVTNHVSLDVSDAEIFSGLLSSLIEKAKGNAR